MSSLIVIKIHQSFLTYFVHICNYVSGLTPLHKQTFGKSNFSQGFNMLETCRQVHTFQGHLLPEICSKYSIKKIPPCCLKVSSLLSQFSEDYHFSKISINKTSKQKNPRIIQEHSLSLSNPTSKSSFYLLQNST